MCDNSGAHLRKLAAYINYNGKAGAVAGMKQTKSILQDLTYRCVQGKLPEEITQVAYDSRKVKPGALFVCIRGQKQDGHGFIQEAIKRGATVILTEKRTYIRQNSVAVTQNKACVSWISTICILETEDTRAALASVSERWFDFPQNQLQIIGVTGTKGKTTTAWMIWKMLLQSGLEAGLIGTVAVSYRGWNTESRNTTPESYELYEILRKMADMGCRYVVMEVSSQALKMHRVDGIFFDTAVFTNLREDHIGEGEHADFAEYMECKRRLFRHCRRGVFNRDDPYWQVMWRGSSCRQVSTYGLSGQADFCAKKVQLLRGSNRLGVRYELTVREQMQDTWKESKKSARISGKAEVEQGERYARRLESEKREQFAGELELEKRERYARTPESEEIQNANVLQEKNRREIIVNAPGKFSVYNSLAAIAAVSTYQVSWQAVDQVLHTLQVPGRIEMLPVSQRFIVMVDYAHNAMALEALLTTIGDYHPGRIICIFGCGGNRSALRRYQMGEVAGRLADLVVITTDNPREENPEKIAAEIGKGVCAARGYLRKDAGNHKCRHNKTDSGRVPFCHSEATYQSNLSGTLYADIPDRAEAIQYGISHAKPGDVVVLAGKGHETCQEINGKKYPMDDRKLAMQCRLW